MEKESKLLYLVLTSLTKVNLNSLSEFGDEACVLTQVVAL
jgi:hypothetical protein